MDIMKKLMNLKAIIIGMRGFGVEIAKNIILSGIDTVTIFDDEKCLISDLSSNYFITEENINKIKRDDACISKLAE